MLTYNLEWTRLLRAVRYSALSVGQPVCSLYLEKHLCSSFFGDLRVIMIFCINYRTRHLRQLCTRSWVLSLQAITFSCRRHQHSLWASLVDTFIWCFVPCRRSTLWCMPTWRPRMVLLCACHSLTFSRNSSLRQLGYSFHLCVTRPAVVSAVQQEWPAMVCILLFFFFYIFCHLGFWFHATVHVKYLSCDSAGVLTMTSLLNRERVTFDPVDLKCLNQLWQNLVHLITSARWYSKLIKLVLCCGKN